MDQNLTPEERKKIFVKHVIRSLSFAIFLLAISLGAGIWGYRHFEGMSLIDAFANAAMILSGMGPLDPIHTSHGKLFAGCYALYSGIAFLVAIAVVLAPILHHLTRKLSPYTGSDKKA